MEEKYGYLELQYYAMHFSVHFNMYKSVISINVAHMRLVFYAKFNR